MATKKRLPRLTTGRQDLDAWFEAIADAAEQALAVTTTAPLNSRVGPDGIQIWSSGRRPIQAKLTSGGASGLYAWKQQSRTATHTWADLVGGLSGTTSVNPAREKNGNTTVVVPSVVELKLDPDNGDYVFMAGSC